MRIDDLAINGGEPIIPKKLPAYSSIGKEESLAVQEVIKRGSLSGFYGSWTQEFFGGYEVKRLEEEWCKKFKVNHAISMNSNTSGLYASMGAIEISPGDEVIVPPLTMSATAMSSIIYGGIPIFADIDKDTFCIDIEDVKRKINSKTKAIISVNLFGNPAANHELLKLCRNKNIYLIEDNAQAPLATEQGKYTGTIGDIGIFSLNYHKHIHSGEGGICVTNNPKLALRLQGIRNHGENIVKHTSCSTVNMIGFNFRMTELSASIGYVQLKKIESEVRKRKKLAEKISAGIGSLEGISAPFIRKDCEHVYYVLAIKYDEDLLGVSISKFSEALNAEGFPNWTGYSEPLYLLPIFQKKIAIGKDGWPFNLSQNSYQKGICPVAERLHEKELICFETCAYEISDENIKLLIKAFIKVYKKRHLL